MAPQTMASFRLTTIGGAVMEDSGGRQTAVASPAQVSRTGDKKKTHKTNSVVLWWWDVVFFFVSFSNGVLRSVPKVDLF